MKYLLVFFICFSLNARAISSPCQAHFLRLEQKKTNSTRKIREAIKAGDIHQVQEILQRKPNLNYQGSYLLNTSLHLVAYGNNKDKDKEEEMIKIADLLLKAGVDPHRLNKRKETALDVALIYNHTRIAIFLKSQGIKQNILNIESRRKRVILNQVKYAIETNKFDLFMELIQVGIDLTERFKNGNTLLHLAVSNRAIKIIEYLLEIGIEVNTINNFNKTALDLALENATDTSPNKEIIDLLESRQGKKSNQAIVTDNYIKSVQSNDLEMLRKVLDQNPDIDVNVKNNQGETALHAAARTSDNPEMIQVLLNAAVRINTISFKGETAFDVAIKHENKAMIKFFKNQGEAIAHKFPDFLKSQN